MSEKDLGGTSLTAGAAVSVSARESATARHTPGPWTFEVAEDFVRVRLARSLGMSTDGLNQCELRTVATFAHNEKLKGPHYLGVVYDEANAHLIAAAPEMLAELKAILGWATT